MPAVRSEGWALMGITAHGKARASEGIGGEEG